MSRLVIKRIQALVFGIVLALAGILSCICLPIESLAEEGEQAEEQKTEEQKAEEQQAQIEISAPSAVLMEASTGTVIYGRLPRAL